MLRSLLLILLGLGGIVMDDASKSLWAQDAYPRVVSPTGRFYGPTQAHYQYERQYGRPWYGGGTPYNPNTGAVVQAPAFGWGGYYSGNLPYYGYGYSVQQQGFPLLGGYGSVGFGGYGAYGWNGVQQYQVLPQQLLQFGQPPVFSWQQAGDQYQQQLDQQRLLQLQQQQQFQPQQVQRPQPQPPGNPNPGAGEVARGPLVGPGEPVQQRPHAFMPAEPSTAAQRQNSIHFQGQGDIWFRQLNYLQAYSRYKQAAAAAPDLAAPRFRMAYALMALQRYELAVPEFQRGIRLDPQYPLRGESPQQILGEQNQLVAAALPQSVAAWVRQDIRSPDRLFLLGALLMISGDQARARILLETATEFGGPAEHLTAFLNLGQAPADAPGPQQVPADDRPPIPEAVEKMLNENRNWLPATPQAKRRANPGTIMQSGGIIGPQPKPPQPAEAAPVEPEESVTPAKPTVSVPESGGYQTIPKKGSAVVPTPAPALPKSSPPAVESSKDESGPVIPIPGAGQ